MRTNRIMMSAAVLGAAALAVSLMGTFPAKAQQAPPGPGRAGERLAQQLNLTEEQKTQVQSFREQQRTQMQALRNETSLTREQRRQRMQEIQQATRDNIRSILSAEQQMKADELRQQMQQRMEERREVFADRALKGMSRRLDLSESQQSTIQSYLAAQKTQIQALRDNTALTQEQRREQIQTLRQQTRENIRATLTPDQQQKLDDLRQRAGQRFQNRPNRRFNRGGRRGMWGPMGPR